MENITLSKNQETVIKGIVMWYNLLKSPIYIVGGYAGTGKSFMTKYAIQELGLKEYEVLYCAYTGKAAHVMLKKGNPSACTLHKAFYDFLSAEERKEKIKEGYYSPKSELDLHFMPKAYISPLIKLIVIDEFSMVPDQMVEDIMKYNVKILALCDPGQLPPVKAVNTYINKLDAMLTEIFRQDDDDLIQLSFDIRNGKRLSYNSNYGKHVKIINKDDFNDDINNATKIMSMVDQVLCGKNDTRIQINNLMREYYSKTNPLPQIGDKLIVTKNNFENCEYSESLNTYIPLINGIIGTSETDCVINNQNLGTFNCSIKSDDVTFNVSADSYYILNELIPEEIVDNRRTLCCKPDSIDYGYAITVHKSQGSQFPNILVYAERLAGGNEQYKKWLYTAVTRAEKNVILVI